MVSIQYIRTKTSKCVLLSEVEVSLIIVQRIKQQLCTTPNTHITHLPTKSPRDFHSVLRSLRGDRTDMTRHKMTIQTLQDYAIQCGQNIMFRIHVNVKVPLPILNKILKQILILRKEAYLPNISR